MRGIQADIFLQLTQVMGRISAGMIASRTGHSRSEVRKVLDFLVNNEAVLVMQVGNKRWYCINRHGPMYEHLRSIGARRIYEKCELVHGD
jgi:hypothetical protein